MTLHGIVRNFAYYKKRTTAKEVQALGSDANGRAIKDTFIPDITSRCWFKSSSTFFSTCSDDGDRRGLPSARVLGGAR